MENGSSLHPSAILREAARNLEEKGYGSVTWWVAEIVHGDDVAGRQRCRTHPQSNCESCQGAITYVEQIADRAHAAPYSWPDVNHRIVALCMASTLAEEEGK